MSHTIVAHMLYIIANHIMYSFHVMHSIRDETPEEVTTEENPTIEVVDGPPPKPLQSRHLSIPNLFFSLHNVPRG